jgi:NAD(P)H dehydrogenase (quinone)
MSTFAMHHGMLIVPAGYALGGEMGETRTGGSPLRAHPDKQGLSDDEQQIALQYAQFLNQCTDKLTA